MDWIAFDRAYVLGALPLVRRAYIAAFIDGHGIGPQIDRAITGARIDFRAALRKAGNTLDADETKLPTTCLRHAQAVVEFEIAKLVDGMPLEGGGVAYEWRPGISELIRAEVYLRSITETKLVLDDESLAGPSYGPGPTVERQLPDTTP